MLGRVGARSVTIRHGRRAGGRRARMREGREVPWSVGMRVLNVVNDEMEESSQINESYPPAPI